MKIKFIIEPPLKKGHFSVLKIYAAPNEKEYETIHIDFYKLYDFTKDNSSIAFDFLLISLLTYCIDKFVLRKNNSVDGWSRQLEVCFPVLKPVKWNKAKNQLEKTLSFLTGDYWNISFEKRKLENLYPNEKIRYNVNRVSYKKDEFQAVSLFSGGLDSLVGVIDKLEELKPQKGKLLLASHFDGSAGAKSDQERILPFLNKAYKQKFEHIICGGRLANNAEKTSEPSSRSRSIIFIGIGVYLANNISANMPLLIPENGTISLNIPLSPSRRSSCSTRTTHPYFLKSLQETLLILDIHNPLINPYLFKTKGELVAECKNLSLLKKVAFESASCGKRGRKQYWDNKSSDVRQCGKCMPCIYRRASLHKIKMDKETFGIDIFKSTNFDINSNTGSTQDINACLSFLKKSHSKNEIVRQLVINGPLPGSDLSDYADIILRTKDELKRWIASKKNKRFNIRAGIK